jgi:hypothetical protein
MGVSAVKRYIAENFADCCDLLNDLCLEYRESMFRSMDMDHCRAWYKFKVVRSAIKAVIDKKPDFELDKARELEAEDLPGTVYYDWLRCGEAKALEKDMSSVFQHNDPADGVGVLGTLRLYDDSLMIETFGRRKFNFAKKLMTRYFGRKLKLSEEKTVDLAEQVLNRDDEETAEPPSVPQSDIPQDVKQEMLEQFHRRHYEKFIDDTIPMLDDMTPRQAATDIQMRPRLIELMKLHLNGIEKKSRDEGLDLDLDWVLDELNLNELR